MATAQFLGKMQTVVPTICVSNTQTSGTPTIVQLSNKGQISQPTIIQQNGQQYIITTSSKLGNIAEQANSASSSSSSSSTGGNEQNSMPSDAIVLPNSGQTIQTVYPVQYIDGSDTATFSTSNRQIEYIELNSGKPIVKAALSASNKVGQYQDYNIQYATSGHGTTYYQNSQGQLREVSTVPQLNSSLVPAGTQIVMHQGNTFLLQSASLDEHGSAIAHTTRASPVTVQWLIDNYETAEGVSLPRSTLYNHYLRHCHEHKIDPMNPASFGKLIRSVFLGLRTRRLGTRGNSKYHYYGIRIKPSSALNQFQDEQNFALRHYPFSQAKRVRSEFNGVSGGSMGGTMGMSGGNINNSVAVSGGVSEEAHQHQQFLGDASAALPSLGEVNIPDGCILPDGITEDDVQNFVDLYMEHCESILDTVVNLQFSFVEVLWQQFWRTAGLTGNEEEDKKLPKDTLAVLCSFGPVRDFVRDSDYTFYQSLVEVLIPAVLRPIPSSLTQAIRNFAKSLEGWMRDALKGIDDDMVHVKLSAVTAFAQTLRRYTSLNHLAQAARAVLTNSSQINQMLMDLNRVDFANVQEQASWVCRCDDQLVLKFEQDFKRILQQQTSLEQWAIWLDEVVRTVLEQHEGRADYPRAARQFLLKWSFYSSMVIRDLTLRSAASFGSFHLIRLLYDEYMFFLVEHKVAAHLGQTPVSVVGDLGKSFDCGGAEDVLRGVQRRDRDLISCGGGGGSGGVAEIRLRKAVGLSANDAESMPSLKSKLSAAQGGLVTTFSGSIKAADVSENSMPTSLTSVVRTVHSSGANSATNKSSSKTLVVLQPESDVVTKRIKLTSSS